MTEKELKNRTKIFALRIIRLVESLPKNQAGNVLGKQLLRSGTSVGANYRSACRGKSQADFIAKLSIAEEEADESCYWLELIAESGIIKVELLKDLMKESDELTAILTASGITAKQNNQKFKK